MFKTRTLPTIEKERDFHRDQDFSSFEILGSQMSRSASTEPKTVPHNFVFLTQLRPSGSSTRSRHRLSHMALVFPLFSLSPDPRSYKDIALKRPRIDRSSFTNTVVSSAYWPSISGEALITQAKTSTLCIA